MAAMRGLHTPQATTTWSASTRPLSVTTAVIRRCPAAGSPTGSVSRSSTSVLANTDNTPLSRASWRINVPACSESTTETLGV